MELVDKKRSSPDDQNFKRRMKIPVQLEALEKVLAEDRCPAEAIRPELSSQLNLSDKQLQTWFCLRRLKERKGKDEDLPNDNANVDVAPKKPRTEKHVTQLLGDILASDLGGPMMLYGNQHQDEYQDEIPERLTPEGPKPHSRKSAPREGALPGNKRNQTYAARVSKSEAAAIAAVEAQLGETLEKTVLLWGLSLILFLLVPSACMVLIIQLYFSV